MKYEARRAFIQKWLDIGQAITRARRSIESARVERLPFKQLTDRLRCLHTDSQSWEIVGAVIERPRTIEQNRVLALVLRELLETIDRTTGLNRESLDRKIRRILPILPPEFSEPISRDCLSHRRKTRRAIGFRCLPDYEIDDEWYLFLVRCYVESGDDRFIKAILKHPLRLSSVDPFHLIKVFAVDDYWQMRVVQATLWQDREVALNLSAAYPKAFVWAAGRIGDAELVPEIARCFGSVRDQGELVGIVAWAYGKLGAYDRLEALVPLLDELEKDVQCALVHALERRA